jgi:NADH:ubiquinone oxidoreductase subunit 6 (subunit J)
MAAVIFMVVGGILVGGAMSVLRQPRRTRGTLGLGLALLVLAALLVANGLTRL